MEMAALPRSPIRW